MENSHPDKRSQEVKSAKLVMKIMIGVLILFLILIARFALTSGKKAETIGLPTEADAYQIAKYYIQQDTKGDNISFTDDSYGFSKKSDSVYVVRTEATMASGEKQVRYTTLLRYNGGEPDSENSWTLLDISHN